MDLLLKCGVRFVRFDCGCMQPRSANVRGVEALGPISLGLRAFPVHCGCGKRSIEWPAPDVGPGAITAAAGGAGGERPSNAPVSSRWSRQPRSADDADHGQRPVHRHRRRRPLGPQRDDRGGRRLPFHRVVLLHRLAVRGDRCVVQFADPEPDEPAADRPGDRARDRCGRRVRARARGRLGHVVRRRDSDLAGAPLR